MQRKANTATKLMTPYSVECEYHNHMCGSSGRPFHKKVSLHTPLEAIILIQARYMRLFPDACKRDAADINTVSQETALGLPRILLQSPCGNDPEQNRDQPHGDAPDCVDESQKV